MIGAIVLELLERHLDRGHHGRISFAYTNPLLPLIGDRPSHIKQRILLDKVISEGGILVGR